MNANSEKSIRWSVVPSDKVGDILLIGRHHGAYCSHFRIVKIDGSEATIVPVHGVSVNNGDNTFSTVYR